MLNWCCFRTLFAVWKWTKSITVSKCLISSCWNCQVNSTHRTQSMSVSFTELISVVKAERDKVASVYWRHHVDMSPVRTFTCTTHMDQKQVSVNNTTWTSQTEQWQQTNLQDKRKCIWRHQQLARSLLRHFADHVVEDASVVEVGQLHVRVVPHPHLENLPGVQLQNTHGQRSRLEETNSGWNVADWCPWLTLTSKTILGESLSGMVMV